MHAWPEAKYLDNLLYVMIIDVAYRAAISYCKAKVAVIMTQQCNCSYSCAKLVTVDWEFSSRKNFQQLPSTMKIKPVKYFLQQINRRYLHMYIRI